jgi:hypothetical protein
MIELIGENFAAGESKAFSYRGTYFEIIEAPAEGLTVLLTDKAGATVTRMLNIGGGVFVEPGQFEQIQIKSVAAQTVRFFVADGKAGTRRVAGSVQVTGNVSINDIFNFTNAAATVTNASASLVAALPNREYLLIQNKDSAGTIFVNFGAAATVANGIRIVPGGYLELANKVSPQQIFAIGDIASNANIVVCQG